MPRKYFLSLAILSAGFLVAYSVIVFAQAPAVTEPSDEEITASGITFPITELGNCADKDACRAYCNEPTQMDECISFAKEHGLMNKDEADKAKKFRGRLQSGGGPGGCTNPQDCQAFCSDVSNLETCIQFAKESGYKDQHVKQGERVLSYIKSGGQTPGGCTSKETCEKYCGDFSHAQECFEFAQKSGIAQVRGEMQGIAEGRFAGGIPPGQFQKFLELIKKGETPGGCKSKDECEMFCSERSHFEECVSFGEKAGFIEREHAEKVRQLGGFQGPGGCNSPQSCRDYCNDPAHREDCFKFAEEHGFVSREEVKHTKEGLVTLRSGFDNAPEEVKACLKSVLGQNIIEDIQSGKLVPGPEIGERVKSCFEKFGRKGDPHEFLEHAPPQVLSCLKEKLGDAFADLKSGKTMPTPEIADTLRVCAESANVDRHGIGNNAPRVGEFLRSAPPGIAECLKGKLGDEFEKLQSGKTRSSPDLEVKMKSCFQTFRPQNEFQGRPQEGFIPRPGAAFQNLPEKAANCLKTTIGEEAFGKISSGEQPTDEIKEKIRACVGQFQENFSKPQPPPGGLLPPPNSQILPPAVVECVNMILGADGLAKFRAGEIDATAKQQIYTCASSKTNTAPPGTVCAQVITPAHDPATGACKQFPTPCDVPLGWIKGCERINTPPPSGIQTYPYYQQSPTPSTYYQNTYSTTTYPTQTEPPPLPPPSGNLLDAFRFFLEPILR